ncbi:hypothetical protein [Shinella sp. HZN7]|uniref:hypothetical protein n=1 Tax=Shinella sp. (strain HZN7) TaxID=879274 RepID=UPI0007DAB0CC|nr:hypothetical protein [Shinella sp. HZN7]ANH03202.1 hypothetical protein shn_03535 [Shinella sp. HZN7]
MIGRMAMMAALVGLALPAAAGARPLDDLLQGFDNACDYSDALAGLLQSSYAFARKEGTIAIPAGYEAVFGPPSVRPQDEYLHIVLPVTGGTWRGVPVKEIEVYITALASGFSYHAVIFPADALEAAEAAFRERGLAAQEKLAKQDETGFGWDTGFAVTDGVPRYQCDLST